jgi:hypothetical protein
MVRNRRSTGCEGLSLPGGPGPAARRATSESWVSSWLPRYECRAIVVTVLMTAATTAISATDETTSRVRSERGLLMKGVSFPGSPGSRP